MKIRTHSQLIAFTLSATVTLLLLLGISIFKPSAWNLADTASAKTLETSAKPAEIFSEKGLTLSDDLFMSHPRATPLPCPSPSREFEGNCVLDKDEKLSDTLVMPPDLTLDCQLHAISATTAGLTTVRSKPEVGILLDGVRNVTIKNCTIKDFDFGIFAVNSKISRGGVNTIQDNVINARFVDVSLMHVDNTQITGNALTFKTVGGRGVVVELDSDRNAIQRNTITADFTEIEAVQVPGPTSASTNPIVKSGAGIVVGQIGSVAPTLLNAVIKGKLYQLLTTDQNIENLPIGIFGRTAFTPFTERNSIADNWISIPSCCSYPDATDGIALPVALSTDVTNNTISGATYSVRVGIQAGDQGIKDFPGKCSVRTDNSQSRLCFVPGDCFITGVDAQTNSGETCDNVIKKKPLTWLSIGNAVHDNKILGPFVSGITLAGKDTQVRGNNITGPQRISPPPPPPPQGPPMGSALPGAIVLVGPHALGTAIVSQNFISNVHIALSLQSQFASLPISSCTIAVCPNSCLGAQISLNDFTDYDIAVQTNDAYSLMLSVLSVNGQGNFWGPNCLDPNKVQKRNGDKSSAVTDCAAFLGPIARASPNGLPLHYP